MSPLGFAWRSLLRQPARATLGATGVAVVGALLFDMLLLSQGLLVSFRDLLESTGYEVRVTATAALPGMGPALTELERTVGELQALPEVEQVVPLRFELASAVVGGRLSEVTVMGAGNRARGEWRVVRGRDLEPARPGQAPDVVVNETLAAQEGLQAGSTLTLRPGRPRATSAYPPTTFHVCGIAEFPFSTVGERMAAMDLRDQRRARIGGEKEEADLMLVATRPDVSPEAAVAAIRQARRDLHPFSIAEVLERFRQNDFSYFRQMSFVLSTVTSLFAFLLVGTLLTVSTNQRIGEVAALRAVGFPRRRVVLDLLAESLLMVGAGALFALPLGFSLARVLDDILRQMPGLPERLHFFVFTPGVLLQFAALLLGTALLAAAYPAVLVARLPIADTLRREVVS